MARDEAHFDLRTQCMLESVQYDFTTRIGHLVMGPMSAADMQGCIDIFTGLDPKVEAIVTWRTDPAGLVRDTSYLLHKGEWRAIPHNRPGLGVAPPPGYVEVGE